MYVVTTNLLVSTSAVPPYIIQISIDAESHWPVRNWIGWVIIHWNKSY